MLEITSNYGPFAPVVGYAGAIIATAFALFTLWAGKMEKWRPPDENLPGAAKGITILLCSVSMVLLWYSADPDAMDCFARGVAILALLAVSCFLYYNYLLGRYVYTKIVSANGDLIRIFGGRNLLPEAEKKREKYNVDIQTLLEGAAYNPDLLWSRRERERVKWSVLASFICTLWLGTLALSGAGFLTQVLLTKKAATSVIKTIDAPGLEGAQEKTRPNKTK